MGNQLFLQNCEDPGRAKVTEARDIVVVICRRLLGRKIDNKPRYRFDLYFRRRAVRRLATSPGIGFDVMGCGPTSCGFWS